ncbi:MAG: hypothetical protein VKK04_01800 [Synechococcales bacterium]|nr:hypothetical protein [Synechococcales bacterium]
MDSCLDQATLPRQPLTRMQIQDTHVIYPEADLGISATGQARTQKLLSSLEERSPPPSLGKFREEFGRETCRKAP